jgi:hypothetical protein
MSKVTSAPKTIRLAGFEFDDKSKSINKVRDFTYDRYDLYAKLDSFNPKDVKLSKFSLHADAINPMKNLTPEQADRQIRLTTTLFENLGGKLEPKNKS